MRRNERKIIETTDNTATQITPEAKTENLKPSITLSEEQETATVSVAYGGERFDPAQAENDLAYTMLKRSTSELTYIYTEDVELSNKVCAVLREN